MDIYEPAEDSYLLQKYLKLAKHRVLDMGTGSGIHALTLVKNPNVLEVIAVDINPEAIKGLNKLIEEKSLRKIKAIQSDLFENVRGHFNTIIFNPPYLPQDKGIEDVALYGGKNGWEISERFFKQVSLYLFPDGTILFLFSSLTNKSKINEIIKKSLLEFKELDKEKMAYEVLYVYQISKSLLLRELESKSLENIAYFDHGKRGIIYTAIWDRSKLIKTHFPSKKDVVKVAIKTKLEDSKAMGNIANEAEWLKVLNKHNIGPRFLFSGENYLVYRFVEGEFILDWLRKSGKKEIFGVIKNLLSQCFVMDKLKVNKEEMHHPTKHIIINESGLPILLDFERCSRTDKPKNVTQFVEFLCRIGEELNSKGITVKVNVLRDLAGQYKDTYDEQVLKNIIKAFDA